ncbi:Probable sulfate transporter Rv1739c/MT1781 [Serratia fonticola]|uniref:Probable sulfate transporter Rv1739c/MT1781 n=1 Tax=Serratia fonticola TaxID=47917 RepID=A0A4V6KVE1_SERFO|nr:Probable sulfate transporter Rv1739c/MT1781 [Serratia fonticola]
MPLIQPDGKDMQRKSLQSIAPGLMNLLAYERSWLKPDIRAGLSVGAVALPVAIAYAELAGVSAIVGLYSCILPMIAYAIFGSSRQLIVGPDAATCAVIAAVVTPLAAGHTELALAIDHRDDPDDGSLVPDCQPLQVGSHCRPAVTPDPQWVAQRRGADDYRQSDQQDIRFFPRPPAS